MPARQNLTYLDFRDEVESGKIKTFYFISAYDNYFVSRAAELLKEKLFGSKDNNENYFIRYADDSKYTEVLDLCSNFTSIFSPKKLVVLKKCEKLGRALQQILIYTEKPDEDTVLMLVFDRDYVIERKLNTEEFGFYEFSELPRKYFFQWIAEQFENRDCSIDEPVLELFASSVPYNYDIAVQEIEKISNNDFGGKEKIISKEIILNFIGFDKMYTPDDLMVSI
ncbi:MAG: DNA polymerase III subunit delta, partial [Ignavibacteria bacterium]